MGDQKIGLKGFLKGIIAEVWRQKKVKKERSRKSKRK